MKKILAASVALAATLTLGACAVEDTTGGGAGGSGGSTSAGDSNAKSGPNYTVSQDQAIKSAESYLAMGTGYSRAGLIGQLSAQAGEGFPMKDAVFAVNHVRVDWRKQAVLSAKSYMEMGGYSRQGLIDQLSSKAGEQFSTANAAYAADQVGLK